MNPILYFPYVSQVRLVEKNNGTVITRAVLGLVPLERRRSSLPWPENQGVRFTLDGKIRGGNSTAPPPYRN